MKCPKCNSEIAENTKFCPECGEKLPVAAEATSVVVENATTENQPEPTPNENPFGEVTKEKSSKKKSKKVIIIVLAAVVLCGIVATILLILNPFCMFGHRNSTIKTAVKVTCTSDGRTESICDDCGACVYSWVNGATGHDFGEIKCNEENTCVKCGEKKFFEHETYSYSSNYCKFCDRYKYNIVLPETPITVYHYYSNGNIKSAIIITDLSVDYSDGIKISYTAKRAYHSQNVSAEGRLAWRLYSADDDSTVIASDIDYTDASIAVGETTKGSFQIYTYNLDLEAWKDYNLVIRNVQD